jgi:hypothetical protein
LIIIKLDFSLGDVEVNQPEEMNGGSQVTLPPGPISARTREAGGPVRSGATSEHGLPRCLVDHHMHTIHDRDQAHPHHCGARSELHHQSAYHQIDSAIFFSVTSSDSSRSFLIKHQTLAVSIPVRRKKQTKPGS